jgi:signal transduction histidine kinase
VRIDRQTAQDGLKSSAAKGRGPLAHLLHALNQPLTGLQCGLELSLVGPQTAERYGTVVREALQLTARMRVLVEAIRELGGAEQDELNKTEVVSLSSLLEQITEELLPVAEAKAATIVFRCESPLMVRASQPRMASVVFRFLESALCYSPTLASGQAVVGTPGTGGRGTLSGGALELSNVDIATEFAKLIVAQRGFEADAKAVTTFDQITQDTIALKQ